MSVSDWLCDVNPLGIDHLKRLYQELGMSQQDVEKTERKAATNDENLKTKAVLQLWKKRNGKKADRHVLLQAIQKSRPTGKVLVIYINRSE